MHKLFGLFPLICLGVIVLVIAVNKKRTS